MLCPGRNLFYTSVMLFFSLTFCKKTNCPAGKLCSHLHAKLLLFVVMKILK